MLSCSFFDNLRLNVLIFFFMLFLTCVVFLLFCCWVQVRTIEFFIHICILFAMVWNAISYSASNESLINGIIISIFSILVYIIAIFIVITVNGCSNSQATLSKIQVKVIQFFKTKYNNYEHLQSMFIDGINVESTQLIIMLVFNTIDGNTIEQLIKIQNDNYIFWFETYLMSHEKYAVIHQLFIRILTRWFAN